MTTLVSGNRGLSSWIGHLTLYDLEQAAELLRLSPLICKMGMIPVLPSGVWRDQMRGCTGG